MLTRCVCLFALVYLLAVADGYNILAVFAHEGKSHLKIFTPIVKKLSEKGHRLTVIVHYTLNIKSDNYREILLNDPSHAGDDVLSFEDPLLQWQIKYAQIRNADILLDEGLESCELMLSNENVRNLIESGEKFDLILAEFFNSECIHGFMYKFQAPLVGISSTTLIPWHNDRFSNPDNPSYIPHNHLWHNDRMSFFERVEGLLGSLYFKIYHQMYLGTNEALIERYFQEDIPDLGGLIRNSSLLLVNSHFSFSFSRPLVPGVVEIGGIHVQKAEKLPENIEKFINDSTHGVIYFSLGSMIKGHTFPQEKRDAFLKAFARLPQRVLWKWENETMTDKPENVNIQKWMPQFDILSHPNVKAFISHGGLLGSTEGVHCGVPMLIMPQYGDQHANARAIEANGGGVILYLKEATEERIYQSLKTILNPEFKAKTQELSERFRDRPMSPMDTAIYWVEYVARYKGAPHLKTAAVDMPLYQYLLLDVFAFLAVISFLFLYITYKAICVICSVLFSKRKLKQN